MYRSSIKNHAADALSRLETGGTHTAELDDDPAEMLVSFIDHRGDTNNDHDGNFDLLCICEQPDDAVQTVNIKLLEKATIAYDTTTPMTMEDTATLGEFLEAQALDRESQAAAQTVGIPASLFMYDCHDVLVRQARVDIPL